MTRSDKRKSRRPTATTSTRSLNKKIDMRIQKDQRGESERFTQTLTHTVLNTNAPAATLGTRILSIEDKSKIAIGTQSNDNADRVSNAVELHSMDFKFLLNGNSSGSPDQHVRLIIVSTNTNVSPDLATILNGISGTNTDINDWIRVGKRSSKDNAIVGFDGKYKVHYDRKHVVSSGVSGPFGVLKFFNVNLRFKKGHKVNYAAPLITDFQKGMFFIFAIQNGANTEKPALSHVLTYTYNV